MAPVLSPKKSIEGAVGGVAGAALLGVIYAAATQGKMAEYALICAVGALISMVGVCVHLRSKETRTSRTMES